jgi:hypothetical protein
LATYKRPLNEASAGIESTCCAKVAVRYYYFMDREFGLIHVKLQTWFPLPIQVYVNGHEWLARKLDQNGIRYSKLEMHFCGLRICREPRSFQTAFVR